MSKTRIVLSFFKINDPYRLVAVFLLLLLIRLPFLINPVELSEQYYWLTIGEAMRNGIMYKDIWDSMAPLAAFTYSIVVSLFGKSVLALNILGMLANFIMAVILNDLAIRNKIYEQNTYLPAFVFVLLTSLHNSFSSFSPVQIGMLFVVMALGNLFGHIEFRAKRDEQIMNIGLFIGVASLFYFPLIMFMPVMLVLFYVFTSTRTRRYFLFVLGSLLPLAFAFCYFWVVAEKGTYFSWHFLGPYFQTDSISTDWWLILPVIIPLVVFFILGVVSSQFQRRLTNFQTRLIQLFIVLSLLTTLVVVLTEDISISLLYIYLPAIALLCVYFLLIFQRGIIGEAVTLIFALIPIFILFDNSRDVIGLFYTERPGQEFANEDLLKDKSIMVLGDRTELYHYGRLGTPFYNWQLSEPFMNQLDYYDNLVFLKESIGTWQPEIIVDFENRWPQIGMRLPGVAEQFREIQPGIWVR